MGKKSRRNKNTTSKNPQARSASTTANNTDLSEEMIEALLSSLENSNDLQAAEESIRELFDLVKMDADKVRDGNACKDAAEKLVRLDGIRAIHSALKNWYEQSREFSELAMRSLFPITFFVPKARRNLIEVGGIDTILETAKKYEGCNLVRADAIALLNNLAAVHDKESKLKVSTSECIDRVTETMKEWPTDKYIQQSGCFYFLRIVQVEEVKPILRSKGTEQLLGEVIDHFEEKDEEVCRRAKETLNALSEQLS